MKTVRITAKTVDEAVEEGLKKLGLSRAEAVIRVIEQPSSGLFGLFNKKDAVVEVGRRRGRNRFRCGGAGGKRHGRRRYGRSSYGEEGKTWP